MGGVSYWDDSHEMTDALYATALLWCARWFWGGQASSLRRLLAALAAVYAATPVAASGGIAGTVSANGVNYLLQAMIPIVEQKLNNMVIPGISGDVREPT